jgi:peptidoglycan pentaglycine glycine transferase (the first glycine)
MTELTQIEWENFMLAHPEAHLLQTANWGRLKTEFGWQVVCVVHPSKTGREDIPIGAQILFKRLPLGFSMAYIPKGPVTDNFESQQNDWEGFWKVVDQICRDRKAVFLKVEPDLWQPVETQSILSKDRQIFADFRLSPTSVQPPRTLMIDLRGDEDQILGRMKQKTRYNIRLALKKGVIVRFSADLDTFYKLISITSNRAEFGVHSKAYYQRAYEFFQPTGEAEILIAEYDGEPLAALMVFARGKRAWYLYGASGNQYRDRMPTYILQWEAMRWARSRGCEWYDLWGVPDVDQEQLEQKFTARSDGLWGVYRFKRGFGGVLRRALGPYDRIYNPLLYSFYRILARNKTQ